MEDIIMNVIERKKVELVFVDVKVKVVTDSDITTTDVLFDNSNDADEVFKVLSNHQAFDGKYNIVTKHSNTITLVGEIVVKCLHNIMLGVTIFY